METTRPGLHGPNEHDVAVMAPAMLKILLLTNQVARARRLARKRNTERRAA